MMREVENTIEPDGRRKVAFEAEARSEFVGLGLTVWFAGGELDVAEFYTLEGVVRWKRGSGLGEAHRWETEAAARSGAGGVGKHFPVPFIDGPFTGDPWDLVRPVLEHIPDLELAARLRETLEPPRS